MRLCQNHFLKEFLGSSCRLVGHAVPAPHGVALGDLDVRNFMVDCANLKSPTPLPQTIQDNSIQDQSHDISQIEPTFNPNESIQVEENHDYDTGYCVPATEVNNDEVTNVMANDIAQEPHPTESLATPPLQISENPFHILDDNDSIGNHVSRSPDLYNMMSAGEYMSNDFNIDSRPITDQSYQRLDLVEPNLTTLENSSTQLVVANEEVIENAQSEYSSEVIIENQPQVSTNTEIRPANRIAYIPCNQLISMTSNRNEPEESSKTNRKRSRQESYDELKLKIRSYQKKLAVVNHRYQALRSRMRGRSKKGRLLEILRNCSDSLNPTLFDIFEHCLTGSKSPHGNRWSDRIKIFATGIYRRSKSAYRFLRTTVELPSESMIKKFMRETELLDQVEDNEFVSSDTDQEDRKEEPSTRKVIHLPTLSAL